MALGYFAILGASVAGYAGIGAWAIAAATIALAATSYAHHEHHYETAHDIGSRVADFVLLRSIGNSLIAASIAYGFGLLVRAI